jgi:hypothetical protein
MFTNDLKLIFQTLTLKRKQFIILNYGDPKGNIQKPIAFPNKIQTQILLANSAILEGFSV